MNAKMIGTFLLNWVDERLPVVQAYKTHMSE